MKIGIILFILGLLLIAVLLKIKFTKDIIKNIGIFVAIIATIYGLILMVQPNEDTYFTYTKTTIVK
jgi:xanthine/uracil/vitamin C permease (AzgA family)